MNARPKNLGNPDESIRFPGISEDLVEIAGMTVARTVQNPGWRWSTDMQPLVGGEWCEARHIGVVISGRLGGPCCATARLSNTAPMTSTTSRPVTTGTRSGKNRR